MPRTDKKKNIDKVTAALVVNPLSTARELAEKTWLWASTANRARQELAQTGTKDPRIISLTDKALEIVSLSQELIAKRLRDTPDDVSTRDAISAWDTSAKRYSLFVWDATDKDWWLKSISELDLLD